MLSTSSKDWKIKSISNFSWTTSIPLDISHKWEISKYFKEMTTQDSTEMSSSIPPSAPISWDSLKKKWPKKEEIQEPWTKCRIFSKNWNPNTSEPPLKNYGSKISPNSVKSTLTPPPTPWWTTSSNSKPTSKQFKSFTTLSETDNSTPQPKSYKPERNCAQPLDISTLTAKLPSWTQPLSTT